MSIWGWLKLPQGVKIRPANSIHLARCKFKEIDSPALNERKIRLPTNLEPEPRWVSSIRVEFLMSSACRGDGLVAETRTEARFSKNDLTKEAARVLIEQTSFYAPSYSGPM
jgi:hypothetical protein